MGMSVTFASSQSKRELKKLEWSVSYKGTNSESGRVNVWGAISARDS